MTTPTMTSTPAHVLSHLVREVTAGQVLLSLTATGERRREALEALALARDVLDDARQLLDAPEAEAQPFTGAGRDRCACGTVVLSGDAGDEPAAGELQHGSIVCTRLDL